MNAKSSNNRGQKKLSKRARARREAREFAMQSVYQWIVTDASPTDIQAKMRVEFDFSNADVEHYSALMKGVTRFRKDLDERIAPVIDRTVDEVTPIEKAVLYVSTYEMEHCIDVPFQIVINEAVEMAKSFGATESHRFVNAAMDRLAPTLRKAEVEAYRAKRRS